jgi:predicted GIY-YIG superfamily endonuclease
VYIIPCDCGRCYIGEISRHLEIRMKEHKYNQAQGLLEISKLAQNVYEEGHKICRLNQTHRTGNTRNQPTSLVDHPINQPSLDISPIQTFIVTAEVRLCVKIALLCWYPTGNFFFCLLYVWRRPSGIYYN